MLVVRSARLEDFEALKSLAAIAGPGFTSLSVSEDDLRGRLAKAEYSFDARLEAPEKEDYLLMLEDTERNEVIGISAVKTGIGINKPFFNFKILTLAQASTAVERRFDMDVMMLVNEFPGTTEVGTLFVHPDRRKGGAGKLVAQARYLLIAAQPERFSSTIISELRGHVDKDGYSPFWEAVGRHFFQMDFNEADAECATSDNQFILDLMPKYPIYVDLLPASAREVIGRTHPAGRAARRMLEAEGFRYDRVVDIFDAGPLVSAPRESLRTLRQSHIMRIKESGSPDQTIRVMVSTDKVHDFRVCYADAEIEGDVAKVKPSVLKALQCENGDLVRIIKI